MITQNIVNLKEYRILLLGDTQTGKTTFLSKLIKNKDDKMYITNHQHELESGLTSSINYYEYIYNEIRYLFFDTPGHPNYLKTLMKAVLSIDYDLVLFFSNGEWRYYNLFKQYFKNKRVQYQNFSSITNHIHLILDSIITKTIKNDNNIIFNILHIFYGDQGLLLSGFLKSCAYFDKI